MDFNVERFMKRMRMNQAGLAKKLNCSQPLVSSWISGSGQPTYDKIAKLIDLGITLDELFGPERARKLLSHPPSDLSEQDFHDGVALVVEEILKARGIIK